MLEGMTYVEAVLWIGARLAEGLAHAHERGVLHRDLKPANVLLTDEGQPMLLDFNLAEDVRETGAAGARVGGTLPYMAPEHLAAYQGRPVDVDARSDLYALGVILYELLTGATRSGSTPGPLEERAAADDPGPAAAAAVGAVAEPRRVAGRRFDPAPLPGTEPGRRYQTARQLQEDLDRQRLHQPLRYAADPSPRERMAKWLRRHPRAVTGTRIGIAAGFLLVLLAVWLFYRGEELARYESADRVQRLPRRFERRPPDARRPHRRRGPDPRRPRRRAARPGALSGRRRRRAGATSRRRRACRKRKRIAYRRKSANCCCWRRPPTCETEDAARRTTCKKPCG